MKVKVVTLDNKAAGEVDLSEAVFGVPSRPDILHQVVNWQLARRQRGTHKAKIISEVSGTGAKPFNQKGSGRARQGSRRAPHMRGGAVIFGPVVRSHATRLNKKVRALGLRTALSDKQREGKLVILDSAIVKNAKTAAVAKAVAAHGWSSVLLIDGTEMEPNFARAAANIRGLDVLPQHGANVYDILRRDLLVLTKAAVEQLQARLA